MRSELPAGGYVTISRTGFDGYVSPSATAPCNAAMSPNTKTRALVIRMDTSVHSGRVLAWLRTNLTRIGSSGQALTELLGQPVSHRSCPRSSEIGPRTD